jgi:glucose/arabinose dehydrogenase
VRALVLAALASTACGGDGGGGGAPDARPAGTPCVPVAGTPPLALEEVARGLTAPIAIAIPPGDTRFFVAEKGGRVRVIEGGRPRGEDFLDLAPLVSRGSEQGLLGLAFHPRYAENGRFFVHYTDTNGDTRVVEYRGGGDVADPASGWTILEEEQPFANHNGGHVIFGPDGKLYVGLGDGGSGFDPQDNGQDLGTRLGKILRLDVDVARPERYAAPPDNPFAAMGGVSAEIFAYGLRNPWRYQFDRETDDLWIGDVGQEEWEEIDLVPAGTSGQNFGWDVVEGNNHCPRAPDSTCTLEGSTLPVHDYDDSLGNAVVGGFVYRGCRMPDLRGTYFFSDNGGGFVRSFRYQGAFIPRDGATSHPALALPAIGTFGEDLDGELVLCSLARGTCARIVPSG